MPSRKKQATNPAQIKISSPELVRLIFVRDESAEDITSWGNIQMQFQVGVARLGMHRIGIELQVELKDLPATECKSHIVRALLFSSLRRRPRIRQLKKICVISSF